MRHFRILPIAVVLAAAPLIAQVSTTPRLAPPPPPPQQPQQAPPPANNPAQPNAAQPTPQGAQPAAPPAEPAPLTPTGGFLMDNVSLTELVNELARRLKINIILDPRVRGSVTIHTYGEVKPVDLMQLLQTILRVNQATIVQVGDLWRIIPITAVSALPIDPVTNVDPKTLPDDERMMLNLIFLKYATAEELDGLITPFLGEGATHRAYPPANLLIIQDNSRSMRRTMELISLFDSETFAGQRVRLFDVQNSRPADLVKELDSVFRAYSLSDKNSAVRFIPIDRINTLIAVAPNPGIFQQVEDWIKKLDVPVKIGAGGIQNYVYRLKYRQADIVAAAVMALYTGDTFALSQLAAMANSGMIASGMGYAGAIGAGGLGYGNPYGGGYGQGYGQGYGYGNPYGGGGVLPYSPGYINPQQRTQAGTTGAAPTGSAPQQGAPGAQGTGQTGMFLGPPQAGGQQAYNLPRIVANPFDNTLLIQASPEEYESITRLIQQVDIAPRQVLIDAKIYEVTLTGALSGGVESVLRPVGSSAGGDGAPSSRSLTAIGGGAGLNLTTGALVSQYHELLGVVTAAESRGQAKNVSAPSIIATDSIPATMNVGTQVPTLTSQAASSVQSGGTTQFANTISNQTTGTTLSILARINSSGVVTMVINQQVSSPQPPAAGAAIQSPSFQNRSMSTQLTVQDGDTIAIGGAITEVTTESSDGIPLLHRIPIAGAIFGTKSYNKARTELIIFLTPHVIYDSSQLIDATEQLKLELRHAQKLMKE